MACHQDRRSCNYVLVSHQQAEKGFCLNYRCVRTSVGSSSSSSSGCGGCGDGSAAMMVVMLEAVMAP